MDLLKSEQLNIITLDRGKEFSKHADLSQELDKAAFLFSAWDRGSNENRNGLVIECFPKGEDRTDLSDEQIPSKADKINKQPGNV